MHTNNQHKVKYVNTPIEILSDKNLNMSERVLLGLIANLPHGLKMSNEAIGRDFACSPRKISRMLSTLKHKGYVTTTGDDGRGRVVKSTKSYKKAGVKEEAVTETVSTPTEFRTTPLEPDLSVPELSKGVDITVQGVRQNCLGGTTELSTIIQPNITKDNLTTPVVVSSFLKEVFKRELPEAIRLSGEDVDLLNDAVEYAKANNARDVARYVFKILKANFYDGQQHWKPLPAVVKTKAKPAPTCDCGKRLNSGEKQAGICNECEYKEKLMSEEIRTPRLVKEAV